jgi:hypothetical protein
MDAKEQCKGDYQVHTMSLVDLVKAIEGENGSSSYL